MQIALICSNYYDMRKETANGTAIFNYSLITELAKYQDQPHHFTAFASGSSDLPIPVESIAPTASIADPQIAHRGKVIMFELALISKAFADPRFDIYHINIGDGDLVMPFIPFTTKPVVITLHHIYDEDFTRQYFKIFSHLPNVFFVSASNAQRRILPDLPYVATIHHGIETELFAFDRDGGEAMMWAGRAIPEKGPDQVVAAALALNKSAHLFGIARPEHQEWLEKTILKPTQGTSISYQTGRSREELIPLFQDSKAFVLPVQVEEAFGLVFIEAMSCGTPVVAYARGAVPEVIEDGVTGFIVNSSPDDIRGNWQVKETGQAGITEALRRLYQLSPEEYATMRKACRQRVEQLFSITRMGNDYLKVYNKLG